ncbi:hypothetical protein SAMN04515671_0522 [Nakamurella panacisegetis]|uniref:O-antigen ligase like membrane protein n=2 Tax=Nakamurella panacisegetis TaxID=1090615 RepID=A0A1H0IJQ0_9ACTN|nr:hypothetical protein SAMN04515671_0522 [Nakamurella panacisegetis]
MLLAVWAAFCLGLAAVLHRRPAVLAILALTFWMFVPGVAGHLFTGRSEGSLSYQPATWLVLFACVVQMFRHPSTFFAELARRYVTYLALLFAILAAVVITRLGSQPAGSVLAVDQMLVPVLMFWLVGAGIAARPSELILLRNWIIGLAAVQAVLAILQYFAGSVIFYRSQFLTEYWFNPATWDRWMGTTDHPLVLSLVLCGAVPLIAGLRRSVVQISLLSLLAVATLITQSRTAAVLVPVGLIYVMIRSRAGASAKIVVGLSIALGSYLLVTSPIFAGLQSRLLDDTGSAAARTAAWTFFTDNWTQFLYFGDGITTSYRAARIGGLGTSLESAYLMYAVGVGIVVTTIYFGTQLVLVFRSLFARCVRGAFLAGVMMLIIPETFSSLGVETVSGPLLWMIMALVANPVADTLRPGPQHQVAAESAMVSS